MTAPEGQDGVEALARVLHSQTFPWCRQPEVACMCSIQAERILADPGPLLAALVEAGVLTEVYSLARHDPSPDMSGKKVQHAGESPDRSVMERVLTLPHSEGRWIERRYVTEWRPGTLPDHLYDPVTQAHNRALWERHHGISEP